MQPVDFRAKQLNHVLADLYTRIHADTHMHTETHIPVLSVCSRSIFEGSSSTISLQICSSESKFGPSGGNACFGSGGGAERERKRSE